MEWAMAFLESGRGPRVRHSEPPSLMQLYPASFTSILLSLGITEEFGRETDNSKTENGEKNRFYISVCAQYPIGPFSWENLKNTKQIFKFCSSAFLFFVFFSFFFPKKTQG